MKRSRRAHGNTLMIDAFAHAKRRVGKGRGAVESTAMRVLTHADRVDNFFNAVQAAVSIRNEWDKAREQGQNKKEAAVTAVRNSALPIVWASAPLVAYGGAKGALAAETAAKAMAQSHRLAKHHLAREALSNTAAVAKLTATTLKGVKYLGIYGNAIQAAYGGYKGAKEDNNRVRGFFAGRLRQLIHQQFYVEGVC